MEQISDRELRFTFSHTLQRGTTFALISDNTDFFFSFLFLSLLFFSRWLFSFACAFLPATTIDSTEQQFPFASLARNRKSYRAQANTLTYSAAASQLLRWLNVMRIQLNFT